MHFRLTISWWRTLNWWFIALNFVSLFLSFWSNPQYFSFKPINQNFCSSTTNTFFINFFVFLEVFEFHSHFSIMKFDFSDRVPSIHLESSLHWLLFFEFSLDLTCYLFWRKDFHKYFLLNFLLLSRTNTCWAVLRRKRNSDVWSRVVKPSGWNQICSWCWTRLHFQSKRCTHDIFSPNLRHLYLKQCQ